MNTIILTLFSLILSLLLPKTYRATTVIMPPVTDSESKLLSPLSSSPLGAMFPQKNDETFEMLAILKSRTTMTKVIRKFNLIEFYKVKDIERAIETFANYVSFEVQEEGTIQLDVDIITPWLHPEKNEVLAKELSANIANYFISELDIINKSYKTEDAMEHRKFIEKRYLQNKIDLKNAEEKLKLFKEEHKIVSLENQTDATINTAMQIKEQILTNEIKYDILLNTLQADNPKLIHMEKEINALKDKLNEIEYGSNLQLSDTTKIFHTLSKIPSIGMELLGLEREVEIQNSLYTFLTQEFEEAKIQESRDISIIRILDKAVAPINKYKPVRSIIVISTLIFSLFFGLFAIFIYDYKL
tara:strand:- start:195 stop:1265 length:1071 start_codon:yes stop_codon:yes gene_type:complete